LKYRFAAAPSLLACKYTSTTSPYLKRFAGQRVLWVPEANRFSADYDASLREQILDIPVGEIETIVEPDGVGDDIGRESVPLVCVHGPTLQVTVT